MLKLIFKYLQISWSDKWLVLYVFILLAIVRSVLLLVPFRYITVYLGKHMEESPCVEGNGDFIKRVGWAIQVASKYTPWESKCLVQAITGKVLLRHRRLQNTMYLGVAKDRDNQMIAHAWLRSGNKLVTGNCNSSLFTVVAKFADVGSNET